MRGGTSVYNAWAYVLLSLDCLLCSSGKGHLFQRAPCSSRCFPRLDSPPAAPLLL